MIKPTRLRTVVIVFALLVLCSCLTCRMTPASTAEPAYSEPPPTFQDTNLVGTWEAHYCGFGIEWGDDELVLRADGTFKQIYHDRTVEGYVYETPWNEWWVERFPDGRIRVHLQGARFYAAGIETAEWEGIWSHCPEDQPDCEWYYAPLPFYDPIGDESLDMVGELILNVQVNSSGEIVLLHMLMSRDAAWLYPAGEMIEFSR